ncbi:MAG: HTH domain-containing protein, partial [Alphaproteobacteria bacterium]|nr:HTH domain-containing protein [Alphaproteobacteria bacterium]
YSVNELANAYGVTVSAIRKRIDKLRDKFAAALYNNNNPPKTP